MLSSIPPLRLQPQLLKPPPPAFPPIHPAQLNPQPIAELLAGAYGIDADQKIIIIDPPLEVPPPLEAPEDAYPPLEAAPVASLPPPTTREGGWTPEEWEIYDKRGRQMQREKKDEAWKKKQGAARQRDNREAAGKKDKAKGKGYTRGCGYSEKNYCTKGPGAGWDKASGKWVKKDSDPVPPYPAEGEHDQWEDYRGYWSGEKWVNAASLQLMSDASWPASDTARGSADLPDAAPDAARAPEAWARPNYRRHHLGQQGQGRSLLPEPCESPGSSSTHESMPALEPLASAAYNQTMPALPPLAPLPAAVLPALPGPGMNVPRARPKSKPLTDAQQWELTEAMSGTDGPGELAGDDEEMYKDVTGDTTGDDPGEGDEFMEEMHFVETPPQDDEEPPSPSVSQGSCGEWNIEETERGYGAMVPAPEPANRYVQVPITGFDENRGPDIAQRRQDIKGNWRYKPGQPQRAIQRAAIAAAAGLPGARAFSFGCSCGIEHEVSFSIIMVAILMLALAVFVLFKLAECVRESPLTRKFMHQVPVHMQEKLGARVFICSDHPRSNHSYHVYESCHGLKNSKGGMVKAAEVCKICGKTFEESDKHSQ